MYCGKIDTENFFVYLEDVYWLIFFIFSNLGMSLLFNHLSKIKPSVFILTKCCTQLVLGETCEFYGCKHFIKLQFAQYLSLVVFSLKMIYGLQGQEHN